MSSSSKSKKNLERFINNDKEKNSSEKINILELNKSKNEKNNKN